MSSFLRLSLLRALSSTSLVSAAKPTTNGRLAMSATDLMISGAGSSSRFTEPPCFLIFCLATRHGLKIGDRRGRDEHVGVAHLAMNRGIHIARAFHIDARDARRRRQLHGSGDDGDMRARLAGRGGHGESHFSRTAIGEVAHRIERSRVGPAVIKTLRPASRPALAGGSSSAFGELHGFPHAARADFSAGLIAGRRVPRCGCRAKSGFRHWPAWPCWPT